MWYAWRNFPIYVIIIVHLQLTFCGTRMMSVLDHEGVSGGHCGGHDGDCQ